MDSGDQMNAFEIQELERELDPIVAFKPTLYVVAKRRVRDWLMVREESRTTSAYAPVFVLIKDESLVSSDDKSQFSGGMRIGDRVRVVEYDPAGRERTKEPSEMPTDTSALQWTAHLLETREVTKVRAIRAEMVEINPRVELLTVGVAAGGGDGQVRTVRLANRSDPNAPFPFRRRLGEKEVKAGSVVKIEIVQLKAGNCKFPGTGVYLPAAYSSLGGDIQVLERTVEILSPSHVEYVASKETMAKWFGDEGLDSEKYPNAVDDLLLVVVNQVENTQKAKADRCHQQVEFSQAIERGDEFVLNAEFEVPIAVDEESRETRDAVLSAYKEGGTVRLVSDEATKVSARARVECVGMMDGRLDMLGVTVVTTKDEVAASATTTGDFGGRWHLTVDPQALASADLRKALKEREVAAALAAVNPSDAQVIIARLVGTQPVIGGSKREAGGTNMTVFERGLMGELNKDQRNAFQGAVDPRNRLVAIQAPPGSGKSRVAAAVARAAAQRYPLVVVTAAQNVAVELLSIQLVEVLKADGIESLVFQSAVRQARGSVEDVFHEQRLDVVLQKRKEEWTKGMGHKELDVMERAILKSKERMGPVRGWKEVCKSAGVLGEVKREHLRQAAKVMLKSGKFRVVFMTVDMIDKFAGIFEGQDTVMVVDEASTVPLTSIIGQLSGKSAIVKVVSVGDVRQLGVGLVGVMENEKGMLERSLHEAAVSNGEVVAQLRDTYRSHPYIAHSVSEFAYKGDKLSCRARAADRNEMIESIRNGPVSLRDVPILLVQTESPGTRNDAKTYVNKGQEDLAVQIWQVMKALLPGARVIIISTYVGSRSQVVKRGVPNDDSLTVDSAQGKEADVVIVLTVKTGGFSKFFQKMKRLTVLASRARSGMFVIGDFKWLRTVPHWTDLIGVWERVGRAKMVNAADIEELTRWTVGEKGQLAPLISGPDVRVELDPVDLTEVVEERIEANEDQEQPGTSREEAGAKKRPGGPTRSTSRKRTPRK